MNKIVTEGVVVYEERPSLIKSILHYCDEIENTLNLFEVDESEFLNNPTFQHSCSFCILQMGESVRSLSMGLTERHSEINWGEIAGMRNIIAHGYDKINLDTLWFSITEEVPVLKRACEEILKELEN